MRKILVLMAMILTMVAISCNGKNHQTNKTGKSDTVEPSAKTDRTDKAAKTDETKALELPSNFSRYFAGTIGEKSNIQMRLTRKGNLLSGFYLYEKIGMGIPFLGKIDDKGNVEINEYQYVTNDKDDNGKEIVGDSTGKFTGKFFDNKKLQGIWASPKGDKILPFSVSLREPVSTGKLTGTWNIVDRKSGFTLELIQAGNQIKGAACAVIDDARKVDCAEDAQNEPNVEGTVTDNVATVTFQSSFDTESKGTAVIVVGDNGLIWDVTEDPKGESYIFQHALMKRKK